MEGRQFAEARDDDPVPQTDKFKKHSGF